MEIKPTNAYKYLGVTYNATNVVTLPHAPVFVSATLVAIVRDASYEEYI
jgi:hypothetical protein